MFWTLLVITISLSLSESSTINLCDTSAGEYDGKFHIHKGQDLTDADTIEVRQGVYSVAHCAMLASENPSVRTAVFYKDGRCAMLHNFYELSSVNNIGSTTQDLVILQSARRASSGCPACSGTAVCMYDCSITPGTPVVGCMETDDLKGDCESLPTLQFKEYYLKLFVLAVSVTGNEFFSVNFAKLYSWTALRIAFRGTLRGASVSGSVSRFEFTFNDSLCTDPGTIESVIYDASASLISKASGITGLCHRLPAGLVSIALRYYGTLAAVGVVGYATSGTRLFVEELGQPGYNATFYATNACPYVPEYNMREFPITFTSAADSGATLASFTYTKLNAATTLKLTFDGTIRTAGNLDNKCNIWYLKVNNVHCSPQPIGRIAANLGSGELVPSLLRSVEIEGYCRNILNGTHTVSLRIEYCPFAVNGALNLGAAQTGYYTTSRFLVEEFMEGTANTAVMGTDGNMYRIPQFNMQAFAWANPSQGDDAGLVLSFNYVKKYSSSGLRLVYSGDQRVLTSYVLGIRTSSQCCRHYFVINGVSCSNPGPIEGITYNPLESNIHRPVLIDGVCEGIPASNLTIEMYAGICYGYSQVGECYFGWNSFVNVLASEVYVEREIIN